MTHEHRWHPINYPKLTSEETALVWTEQCPCGLERLGFRGFRHTGPHAEEYQRIESWYGEPYPLCGVGS